jgi:hypothetical protein
MLSSEGFCSPFSAVVGATSTFSLVGSLGGRSISCYFGFCGTVAISIRLGC